MDKIVVGGNVTGNVGSCEIKSEYFKVSLFKEETIAVNSCTGEIVAQNIYTNPGLIVGIFLFSFLVSFVVSLVIFSKD